LSKLLVFCSFAFLLSGGWPASAQENGGSVFLPNQEVRVANLPALTAPSRKRFAVLATELETVLHRKAICCGKDSALEDAVEYASLANPISLKEFSTKLQGKHQLSDGQAIVVTADYIPQSSIRADSIVRSLLEQHALLLEWKSHVYVLYGALYDETRFTSGERAYSIDKLFLLDPRFSDARREVVFNRGTDDLREVQGMLLVSVASAPSPWK